MQQELISGTPSSLSTPRKSRLHRPVCSAPRLVCLSEPFPEEIFPQDPWVRHPGQAQEDSEAMSFT